MPLCLLQACLGLVLSSEVTVAEIKLNVEGAAAIPVEIAMLAFKVAGALQVIIYVEAPSQFRKS